jgi:penicillin-binding protein 1B
LDIGIANVLDTLRSLGVERTFPAYSSVLLGAIDLSPFEVIQVYQTLASGGFRTPPRAIRDVLTVQGEPLQRYPLSIEQGFDPAPVFLVTTAMQQVVSSGTARSLSVRLPALNLAGKTGTTDDSRDSWFAGFSGQHVAVVWLGRDDNKSTGLSGASGALKVWSDLLAGTSTQALRPVKPDNIEYALIENSSGIRAGNGCFNTVELPFISGSAPREVLNCNASLEREQPDSENPLDWLREIFQ